MGKAYFPMYNSYLKKTANLSDSELGRLVRALMEYSTYGTKPNLNGRESGVFDFIAYDIDEAANNYAEVCEKNRENINKRYKEDTTVYDRIPTDTKPTKEKQKQKLKQKDNIPPKSPNGDSPARFAEFWQAYPRKVGKAAAEKSWKRLHLTAELFAKIMAAVETAKHTEQWQEQNGRFIPNPATWLNQGRWDDEYADNGTSDFDPDDPYAAWGEGG